MTNLTSKINVLQAKLEFPEPLTVSLHEKPLIDLAEFLSHSMISVSIKHIHFLLHRVISEDAGNIYEFRSPWVFESELFMQNTFH
jgi:hypothetical protein